MNTSKIQNGLPDERRRRKYSLFGKYEENIKHIFEVCEKNRNKSTK